MKIRHVRWFVKRREMLWHRPIARFRCALLLLWDVEDSSVVSRTYFHVGQMSNRWNNLSAAHTERLLLRVSSWRRIEYNILILENKITWHQL